LELSLYPYIVNDGIPTLKDSQLLRIFQKMEEDGTLDTVFYESKITFPTFLAMFKNPDNALWVITDAGIPVGIVWLNNMRERSAQIHFCLFKEVWGEKSVEVGKWVVKELIHLKDRDGYFLFDVITGLTPTTIKAAKWIFLTGMKKVGEVPNACWIDDQTTSVPGVVSYVTRDFYKE